MDKQIKHLTRLLGSMTFIAIAFFTLAAMLGQLDIILSPWYSSSVNTWEMPLPFIFNQVISAMLGWELIYALIFVAFIVTAISAFIVGRESKA